MISKNEQLICEVLSLYFKSNNYSNFERDFYPYFGSECWIALLKLNPYGFRDSLITLLRKNDYKSRQVLPIELCNYIDKMSKKNQLNFFKQFDIYLQQMHNYSRNYFVLFQYLKCLSQFDLDYQATNKYTIKDLLVLNAKNFLSQESLVEKCIDLFPSVFTPDLIIGKSSLSQLAVYSICFRRNYKQTISHYIKELLREPYMYRWELLTIIKKYMILNNDSEYLEQLANHYNGNISNAILKTLHLAASLYSTERLVKFCEKDLKADARFAIISELIKREYSKDFFEDYQKDCSSRIRKIVAEYLN